MIRPWERFTPYPFQTPFPPSAIRERRAAYKTFCENFTRSSVEFLQTNESDSDGLKHGVFYVNELPYLDCRMKGSSIIAARPMHACTDVFLPSEWIMECNPRRFRGVPLEILGRHGVDEKQFRRVVAGEFDAYGTYEKPVDIDDLRERLALLVRSFIDKRIFAMTYRNPVVEVNEAASAVLKPHSTKQAFDIAKIVRRAALITFRGFEHFVAVAGRTFLLSVIRPCCTREKESFIVICDAECLTQTPLAMGFYRAGQFRVWTNGIEFLYTGIREPAENLGLLQANRRIPLSDLLKALAAQKKLFTLAAREAIAPELSVFRDGVCDALDPVETVRLALKMLPWLKRKPVYDDKGFLSELSAFSMRHLQEPKVCCDKE